MAQGCLWAASPPGTSRYPGRGTHTVTAGITSSALPWTVPSPVTWTLDALFPVTTWLPGFMFFFFVIIIFKFLVSENTKGVGFRSLKSFLAWRLQPHKWPLKVTLFLFHLLSKCNYFRSIKWPNLHFCHSQLTKPTLRFHLPGRLPILSTCLLKSTSCSVETVSNYCNEL